MVVRRTSKLVSVMVAAFTVAVVVMLGLWFDGSRPVAAAAPPVVVSPSATGVGDYQVGAPLEIAFSDAMDAEAIEAAIQVKPEASYAATWKDEKTLVLQFTGLEPGVAYQVTIGEGAKGRTGAPLSRPFSMVLRTGGTFEITIIQPEDGAEAVPLDGSITVVFSSPVVPLSSELDQAELPQPLTLEPPAAGRGEWVNTAIFRFTPDKGLAPSTEYTVTISAGLKDISGTELGQDYQFSFTTVPPQVLSYSPTNPEKPPYGPAPAPVTPTEPVKIVFAQEMDQAGVEKALSVTYRSGPSGEIEGKVRWSGNTLVFTPSTPWLRGSQVEVSLKGAKAAGGAVLPDLEWRFDVIDRFSLVRSNPADREKGVSPGASVILKFTSPADAGSLQKNLQIEPEPGYVYVYWDGNTAYVDFGSKADTTYTVTIGAEVADITGWRLGREQVITFTTGDYQPSYQVLDAWRPWAFGDADPAEAFVSHLNVSQLDFSLYSMPLTDFLRYTGDDWQFQQNYRPSKDDLIRSWSEELDTPRNEWGTATTNLAADGGPLEPGVYLIRVSAPERLAYMPEDIQQQVVLVASRNLTLKWADEQALVWVTGWSDGQPVAGAEVRILDADGREAGGGRTDADGVYMGKISRQDPWRPYVALVGEVGEAGFGMAVSTWTNGISPWKYEIYQTGSMPPYSLYLYTDREIYRPGQTVFFKGIVRRDQDARYSVPKDLPPFDLVVNDVQGQEILRETITLNEMGTFNGSLTLAEDAPLGMYYMSVPDENLGGYFGTNFQVAEYRRPEYEVAASTDQDRYVQGDTIAVTAKASYYFGGPVAQADVKWTVLTEDWAFDWTGEGYYDFSDFDYLRERRYYGAYGEAIAEGKGRTDSEGRFTFSVPADLAERTLSQSYTIEVTVTDVNNQEVSARTSVVVQQGEYYIGMRPESYVNPAGEDAVVNVITVDRDSLPVPSTSVQVTFYEHRWYNVREKVGPSYTWTTTEEDIEVERQTVETGADGRAKASFVPEAPGSYKIVAEGQDEQGNAIRSSTYLWVTGAGHVSWPVEQDSTIQLIPDKKSYRVGDTARIMIPSPYSGSVKALFTTERGLVLDYSVFDVESSSQVIEVPIKAEHAPNLYFVAVLMRGEDGDAALSPFYIGFAGVEVDPEGLQLTLDITPDRDTHYEPGDTARFSIVARDSQGRPVEAELSLDMVDKSVQALAGQYQPSLVDHFYSKRGLGVQTAATLTIATSALERVAEGVGKGGGGGEAGGIREDFPETAYWEPTLRTDAEGRASAAIVLPDNLTTWSLEVKAVTADTLVGQGTVEVLSTKDLLLRPVLPRFLVAGDRAELGAVVQNNTDNEITVEVTAKAENLSADLEAQEITLPARGNQLVTWSVEAGDPGQASLTLTGKSGSLSDAVRQTLPVYSYSVAEVVATSGEVGAGETRSEAVVVPGRYQEGGLTVQVEASLVAGMIPGLEYLKHYPYECVEQTLSRFLPNVVTAKALQAAGVQDVKLTQGLSEQVGVGLQRLYYNQHDDGGWGWWYTDRSDPYLSAYVLFGLNQARQADYHVDEGVLDRATAFLVGALHDTPARAAGEKLDADTRAYIAYVLATAGEGDLGASVSIYESREGLSNRGKAHLLLALAILSPEETGRLTQLTDELEGTAILSGTSTHWEDPPQYRTMGTDVVSTAAVVQAFSWTNPDHPLLAGAVRWLMVAREDGHWRSTYATASSILALTDFMVAKGELNADYAWSVALNGREEASGTFGRDNLTEVQSLTVEIARLLARESNVVDVSRGPSPESGEDAGALYYSMTLRYYPPAEELRPVNSGVIVAREYTGADGARVDGAAVNDMVRVKLTIVAPTDLHHVVVEDPLPAGCEGVDTSLLTTTVVGVQPEAQAKDSPWGWWWFSHTEMRDDKVVLFATYLPKGTYEYTYYMRASVVGDYNVRPVSAFQMYFPDVYGHSEGSRFSVTRAVVDQE